jgi:RNA polymerase sigma factor (sigma-70 family)
VGIAYDPSSMLGAAVIDGFRAGDDAAVRAVYEQFGRLVFTVCNRVLGNRSLAEEATQQTFVQAWRGAARFDGQRELGPWLATIARRVAIDIHRREARRDHDSIETASPTHSALITLPASAEQIYEVWQVREAIDALGADEREVVRLQHLGGMSHREIAERLGIPEGTVKSRSFRAHKQLAGRLGHLREPPGPDP